MSTQKGQPLLEKLLGGDRRSIGEANEVVGDVLRDPSLFGVVFESLLNDDPLIRMRAADAVEKITATRTILSDLKARLSQLQGMFFREDRSALIPDRTLRTSFLSANSPLAKNFPFK